MNGHFEDGAFRPAREVNVGVAIALDRQERGQGTTSAAQEVAIEFGVSVVSIAGLEDMIDFLDRRARSDIDIDAIRRYRDEYGCT